VAVHREVLHQLHYHTNSRISTVWRHFTSYSKQTKHFTYKVHKLNYVTLSIFYTLKVQVLTWNLCSGVLAHYSDRPLFQSPLLRELVLGLGTGIELGASRRSAPTCDSVLLPHALGLVHYTLLDDLQNTGTSHSWPVSHSMFYRICSKVRFIHSFTTDLLTEQVNEWQSLLIVLQMLLTSAAFFRSA